MVRIISASDPECVEEAARTLRSGGLVCYPTDTVYGIGAVAGDDGAVRLVFAVKGRPPDKAVPLLLADAAQAAEVAEVTPEAEALMARFWPGALTIVMRRREAFHSLALAGRETVGLRVPDHALLREIIRSAGQPITGTSANRAGAAPPLSAEEAALQVGEKVALIIDGGLSPRRRESTVIDITQKNVRILREGAVGRKEIEGVLGKRLEG